MPPTAVLCCRWLVAPSNTLAIANGNQRCHCHPHGLGASSCGPFWRPGDTKNHFHNVEAFQAIWRNARLLRKTLLKNHSSPDPQQSLSCWHLFWSTRRKIFPIKNPGLSFFSRVQAGANFTSRDKKTQARILVPSSRHRKRSRRWGRWAKCIQMSKQCYTLQFNPIRKSRKGQNSRHIT